MQEAVLAEGLHLVYNLAAEELPLPGGPDSPDHLLPEGLRVAGGVLRVSVGGGMGGGVGGVGP